ncbi:MAG: ComEC/Rec2 family competence protein [Clostridia bacterium]|nr:ComEC/Rec2 family competence protein [Clostridia bacterium]
MLIIRVIYSIYFYNFKYKTWNNLVIEIKINSVEKVSEEGITYSIKYNGDNFQLYIKDVEKIYEYGYRLRILSSNYEITKYNNPYELDYKKYLNSNGYISRIYCIKIIEELEYKKDLLTIIHDIRNMISKKLERNISLENANFIKSIMYGDDVFLDEEIKNKFTNIGLGHMLAVSGTHVIFLLKAFEKITDNEKWKIGKIILLTYFYLISLFNISLLRSLLMFAITTLNKKVDFKTKYIATIYIILLINPYYIFNIGVIFSFLSIFSIQLFYTTISSWFYIKFNVKRNNKNNIKNKIICFIIENIYLTLSAQVLIIPFQVYYFQSITLISILSNIVISIFFNILMLFGFILFLLFFIPVISTGLIQICNILTTLVIYIAEILDSVNYFNISIPKISIDIFISYYLIILIILYSKKAILLSWKNRKKIKRLIKYINKFCYVYIFLWYIVTMYFEKYIIFFNVGQGNMALMHNSTINIIVDIGSTREDFAGDIIINFLKAKNITSIDCIALTHMHTDHMNGIDALLNENINIKYVILSRPCEENTEYELLKRNLKDKNIAIIEVEEEDKLKIENIEINILSPPKNNDIKDDDMLNANSNIYLITLNNKNLLFMGDATSKTEQYIINKYINQGGKENIKNKLQNLYIYQVGHHGSNTSTSESFISKINSCYAIISASKKIYGHPSDEVLELLKQYNFKIKITEKEGAIIF